VFCREDGSHLYPSWVGKRFARAVARTTLPRLCFHDLRHTSAVIGLCELGEWPDETSARLGHSSVASTLETSGYLLPKRGKAVAIAVDQLLEASVGAA
jgi:integrase